MDSILDTVKKMIGVDLEDDSFDTDLIIHINSVFSALNHLGVGPLEEFSIEDNTKTWSDFIGETLNLGLVKSYMYAKVKLLFDPPSSSFAIESLNRVASEYEWRLNVISNAATDITEVI